MNLSINSKTKHLVLRSAILLYSPFNADKSFEFASVHTVENAGTEHAPNYQIQAGVPATTEAMLAMLDSFGSIHSAIYEILPANVLSISATHLVWWLPANTRRVFFDNESIGCRSACVPHPPLLFAYGSGIWWVFALPSNERPDASTQLCHGPYFNVYKNGAICRGTAAAPKVTSIGSITAWENAFFDSKFTHINDPEVRRTKHKASDTALWKELLDGAHTEFPMQMLVPTQSVLGDFMTILTSKAKENPYG